MPHLRSFPPYCPFGGFRMSDVMHMLRSGISVWNDLKTRFRGPEPDQDDWITWMNGVKVVTGAAATVLLGALLATPLPALADTIEAALVRAYQNNPQLNAQRAQVRSTDEN